MFNSEEFKKFSKEMIDYVADYYDNIEQRSVLPKVQPGYLRSLLPPKAPVEPEHWKNIMQDIEKVIIPGVTNWRHPHFHAYFGVGIGYPSIVAEILANALSGPGFSWISMPVSTELETVMMDWIADLVGLPEHFKFSSNGTGGGIIDGFASDVTHYTLLLARERVIRNYLNDDKTFSKLIMYTSSQAHSSVTKAGLLAGIKVHYVDTDEMFTLRGVNLEKAIKEDRDKGFIPFYLCATLGTTTSCAFDNIQELGVICNKEKIWLHVDAAYAGSSFACEENRHFMAGIELADSFNFNLHKWMLVTVDCSALYVKDKTEINNSFSVDPVYLKCPIGGELPLYRNWQIALERRFRSLKVWFTLRLYGQKGIQNHIRKHIQLAREFEALIKSDDMFEICYPVTMGLVCFRLKGSNELNQKLNELINAEAQIHITPSKLGEKFILRLSILYEHATTEHIEFAFNNIKKHAQSLLKS
ncbi:aromatic-L-amino-acid decarboxylase isoform X2 [Hydra vulgaris]|nr:aromatic-L-amino-acid decarboxylase-like isoform X2 [Hydra vulgaris]